MNNTRDRRFHIDQRGTPTSARPIVCIQHSSGRAEGNEPLFLRPRQMYQSHERCAAWLAKRSVQDTVGNFMKRACDVPTFALGTIISQGAFLPMQSGSEPVRQFQEWGELSANA